MTRTPFFPAQLGVASSVRVMICEIVCCSQLEFRGFFTKQIFHAITFSSFPFQIRIFNYFLFSFSDEVKKMLQKFENSIPTTRKTPRMHR
jgi:hypothetical protein